MGRRAVCLYHEAGAVVMPCQVLIAATTHLKETKGEMIAVRDEPTEWGGREGPPDYVILRVTDTSADQVQPFLVRWKTNFQHSVTTNPDLSKQVTVSISQKILDIFGAIHGLKLEIKERLESEWEATIISWSPDVNQMIFDVPASTNLAALKSDILDKFEEQLGPRWLFSEADVDIALGFGGLVELTKVQAQARITDRAA